MTVENNSPVSGPFIADGVNVIFPFTFKIVDASHMVLRIVDADGLTSRDVVSGFTIDPQYIGSDTGGYVQYLENGSPLPAGLRVYPYRNVPYAQPNRIGNQGRFFPETHEQTFDLLSMQIQQVNEKTDRALLVPFGEDVPDAGAILTAATVATNAAYDAKFYRDEAEAFASVVDPASYYTKSEVDTALSEKAAKATTISGGGLVTGGGDLSASRTLTVPKSSNAQALAGTDDATAMTPLRTKEAIAALTPAPAFFTTEFTPTIGSVQQNGPKPMMITARRSGVVGVGNGSMVASIGTGPTSTSVTTKAQNEFTYSAGSGGTNYSSGNSVTYIVPPMAYYLISGSGTGGTTSAVAVA